MQAGMKKALYKVPNGKLLKIFLEENAGKISAIKITGDFFAHPEEVIEKLEKWLVGTVILPDALTKRMDEFFAREPAKLFGVDVPSIITTILSAARPQALGATE